MPEIQTADQLQDTDSELYGFSLMDYSGLRALQCPDAYRRPFALSNNPECVTVIGSYISPFVRKVLVCLHVKAVEYEIDPIVPYCGTDAFTRLNPRRQVPVLIDRGNVITDSAGICAYLDGFVGPPLLPADAASRRRDIELQVFSDQTLGRLIVYGLFQQLVLNRYVWQRPTDESRVAILLEREIPAALDWLEEHWATANESRSALRLPDIAIAAMFRTAALARYSIDAERWPASAARVQGAWAQPEFSRLVPFENLSMQTPYPRHREVLAAAGAHLTSVTLGDNTPRRPPAP